MATLIAFFCRIILLVHVSSTTIRKSVTLTPSSSDINGVEIDVNTHDIITTPNEWNIDVSSNNGWHLHISMNDSWNFLSDRESIITLKTYTDSAISTANKDIIFAFSQNTNKYISSTININGDSSNNAIYPQCNPPNNNNNNMEFPLMADGNIDLLLNDNNEKQNREYKLSNSETYKYIESETSFATLNESPYIIQLINNPINKWSKWQYINVNTLSIIQQCQFEAFSTDYPIDIYISAADIGQLLSVNKFEIIFEYNQTEITNVPLDNTQSKTKVSSNKNNKNQNENNSNKSSQVGSFIQVNTRLIIISLIAITALLLIMCVVLVVMVRRLKTENRSNMKPMKAKHIEMSNMQYRQYIEGTTAVELVLHTTTFRAEESKNYSFDSHTSFASQLTDYVTNDANENEKYENDKEVLLDVNVNSNEK